jgi:hypothetical protein
MILPLWNEKRYAPYKVAALVEVLNEQGIAPEVSLSGSGLSPESLTQPETLTSIRQYITVCHNALQLSNDPETPFSVGSRIPLSAYGMYGFALVCSPTIREYFQVAVKYHRLATPILIMSCREDKDSVSWVLEKSSRSSPGFPGAIFVGATSDSTRHPFENRRRTGLLSSHSRRASLCDPVTLESLQALHRLRSKIWTTGLRTHLSEIDSF